MSPNKSEESRTDYLKSMRELNHERVKEHNKHAV